MKLPVGQTVAPVTTLPARPNTAAANGSAGDADTTTATWLWLIRHAEVEPRYQRVFGGRIDMDLSARGHEQAAALAGYLAHKPFAALYASPMQRVQQTVAPLLVNSMPSPTILPDLREVDFGEWTGLSWEQVNERFGVGAFTWLDQLERGSIRDAESAGVLRARVEPCLRQVLDAHRGQHVVMACHGGVIRMALAILLGWPLPSLAAVEIDYASVTQVICGPHKSVVQLLNFTPWRDLSSRTV